jgi:hypothetical protein
MTTPVRTATAQTPEQQIERGVELLELCQTLQSKADGIDRPTGHSLDKTKTLDSFASDIDQSIVLMRMLHTALPVMLKLRELGEHLQAQGKIKLRVGDSIATRTLDYVLQQNVGPENSSQSPSAK